MVDISGIYKIEDKKGRIYIGSSKQCNVRCNTHFKDLRLNKHFNKKLQDRFNHYGKDFFCFIIIEVCHEEILIKREQYYVDLYNPFYNINLTVSKPPCQKGKPRKPETIAKIRAARWKHAPEAIAKMKEQRGTPEGRERQRAAALKRKIYIGTQHTEEFKKKVSERHKGKIVSEETRKKLSISKTGIKMSDSAKENMRIAQTGKKHSPESLIKMKLAAKKRISSPGWAEKMIINSQKRWGKKAV